ncbi:RNA-directed DNA polymerase, eukaryota [Tanacetum coccineum]
MDDLAKISSSVYVFNFPSHLMVRELWQICGKKGTLVDVYIAKHKNKLGQMFAFCHFIKVSNQEALIESLSNIWIRKLRLHANMARFDRKAGGKSFHAGVKIDSKTPVGGIKTHADGVKIFDSIGSVDTSPSINLNHDNGNDFPLAVLGLNELYGYVLWKSSRDFTRPLRLPSGLKGLLHTLNSTVIPTKLYRMMVEIFEMVDVAQRSRLGAWLRACCLFIFPSKSKGSLPF